MSPRLRNTDKTALSLLLSAGLSACAAQPSVGGKISGDSGATEIAQQVAAADAIRGVRVTFQFSDYHGLSNPNQEGCAGDARNFYDPIALSAPGAAVDSLGFDSVSSIAGLSATVAGSTGPTGALRLPEDVASQSDQTIRPSFIKNISVDMTDANSTLSANRAGSCSLGNSSNVPATSSCATFDFGAVGGVPSTLGGTMLVIGGVQGYNYSGQLPTTGLQNAFPSQGFGVNCGAVINQTAAAASSSAPVGYTQCYSGVYALGVNTLPLGTFLSNPTLIPSYQGTSGPTGAASIWSSFGGTQGSSGPAGSAGASASYDPGLQQVLLFGGAAPLAGFGSNAPGVSTYDTWTFDIKSQQWHSLTANIYLAAGLTNLFDNNLDIESSDGQVLGNTPAVPTYVPKQSGARSLFGYLSVPGMGVKLDQMKTTGVMASAMIDETDRLLIIGGTSTTSLTGTHRFNPTYGPEIQNWIGQKLPPAAHADTTILNSRNLAGGGPAVSYLNVTPVEKNPVQWIDSYENELMTDNFGAQFHPPNPLPAAPVYPFTQLSSRLTPDLPPIAVGPTGGEAIVNIAFAPLVKNDAAGPGVIGTGYVAAAGGFDATKTVNLPDKTVGDDVSMAGCTNDFAGAAPHLVAAGSSIYSTNTDLQCGGGLSLLTRYYNGTTAGAARAISNEDLTSNWSAIPNYLDLSTLPNTPAVWTQLTEETNGNPATTLGKTIPLLGGQTMLPGFNLFNNEVVLFGGLDCRGYVQDTSAPCTIGFGAGKNAPSSGRYLTMGISPADMIHPSSPVPSAVAKPASWASAAITGTLPYAAGMASARGLDKSDNVIIVAWGGAVSGGSVEGRGKIYYLAKPTGASPTAGDWGYAAQVNNTVKGDIPAELINASMVFSHVTRKFYLFGGYDPSTQLTRGDTYELSVVPQNPAIPACTAAAGTGNCTFVWRKLNNTTGTGLSCYPTSCPQARRSHRMAEVNYFNRNPGGINPAGFGAGYNANGEHPCTASQPCSYGIFMEGGTPEGYTFLSDRWMFDPTANGGNGHWQSMGEFPPRELAAMATVDYTLPTNGQVLHRAIMFGGETGMQNSQWSPKTDHYYVPPTLGDSWTFDYVSQSWNRLNLVGQGYEGAASPSAFYELPGLVSTGTTSGTEFAHRQAFDAKNPGTYPASAAAPFAHAFDLGAAYSELSPPPLSGAIMVTRTKAPPPTGKSGDTKPSRTLNLPEVYMFGGRLKDGSFSPLGNVYKFCAGSSGEAFTFKLANGTAISPSVPNSEDYVCDAFDPITNPGSPSPIADYAGRWLTKKPDGRTAAGATIFPSQFGSFLGAGAYDSARDRIVLFGGLASYNPLVPATPTAITDKTNLIASANVYEYTPPQPQLANPNLPASQISTTPREGRWTFVPSCAGNPAPEERYGHSMSYDTRDKTVIIVGGYAFGGEPKVWSIDDQAGSTTYTTPEVWTGRYCSNDTCDSKLPDPIDGGAPAHLTNAPCYFWQPIKIFGNSTVIQAQLPPVTGLSHAASVFIPATGFSLGYYSMFDQSCTNAGPLASPDPALNKLLAGGAYIDIDRSKLGANENLLLNLTYLPMGTGNTNPDDTAVTADQSAVFRVHLIKTGQTQQQLEAALQPRYMGYTDTQQFPQIVQSLSVLAPPAGQIAQEQVMLPITVDPGIDRIRIERYSGSGILIDAAVYRMGTK